MTGIGTGLAATLGIADETAVGTFEPPARWLEFNNESLGLKKKTIESAGIYGGLWPRASRRAYVSRTVDGKVNFDVADRGFGLLLKHMIGSNPAAPTQVGTTSYYKQVHVPSATGTAGMALSLQKGVPMVDGDIQAFSYRGLKVEQWDLDCKVDAIASLDLSLDGWDEDTTQTYAAASYTLADVLHFAEGTVLVGGAVSTSAGVTSIAGGTAIATCKSIKVTGKHKLDTKRYYLGTNGVKAEQLEEGFRDLEGELEIDFANMSDYYTAFYDDTQTALEFKLASAAGAELDVIIPAIFWGDDGSPQVASEKIVTAKAKFRGLSDGTNPPIQFIYTSLDSAA